MQNRAGTPIKPIRRFLIALTGVILLAISYCSGLTEWSPGRDSKQVDTPLPAFAVLLNDRHFPYLLLAGALAAGYLILVRLSAVRRQAECAGCHRQEGEMWFRAFMEHSPAIGYIKDETGRLTYVNEAYCKVFNVRAQDRIGAVESEFMAHAIAAQLHANDQRVVGSKCAYQFEELTQLGGTRNWLSYKFPIMGHEGKVFLGGASFEITEMVKVQNALRESEARYRQIVEYAGDIIVRCDREGRLTYINEMGARVLKIPPQRLQGRRALSLVSRDARRRTRSTTWRELAQGVVDFYMEVPVTVGDGSEVWLGQTIRVLRSNGSIQGFHAICRDITDRRKMEMKLRESEERFRLLYENGPVAYHEIDCQGVIQQVNRAECEMLGYSEAELVGRKVIDLMSAEDREVARAAIIAKVNEQVPLRTFNRTYLRQDGRRLRLEIYENLLRDSQGEVIGIHSVLLDITQRHLAEMLDRDRWKVSEMMAKQQPLDLILSTIATMIGHQDETLLCIPIKLVDQRLEPVCPAAKLQDLCDAIRELDSEAFSAWPAPDFNITRFHLQDVSNSQVFGEVAAAAKHLGIESCWSIPILSSSQQPLGLLLTFSPCAAEVAPHEQRLLEAASRISALAIEHRYLTDLLAFQASHDSLTRLPNRSTFESRLQDAIALANQRGEQLALFFVDLDRFKEVNDTFGHSRGDELLRQVAGRLRRCIRHTDLLARIGGDEFSLLLSGVRDASEANRLAEGILRAFHSPFEISGWQIQITASIGISFYPRDGLDAPTLQRNSDTAMYSVKNTGKNSFRCYAADVHSAA
jgi:diguanylate cyclase (GGDEF)-like protein/PAS domain S-box-containing protein